MPKRSEVLARMPAPAPVPLVPAALEPDSPEVEEAFVRRMDEALLEKELVERAVARIRAETAPERGPDLAHGRQIQILERRLTKLANLLEEREGELERIKRQELVEPGIASVYDSVQGIASDAPMKDAKRALMKRLFEQNVELHDSLRGGRSA
jgi:hypothetical protein